MRTFSDNLKCLQKRNFSESQVIQLIFVTLGQETDDRNRVVLSVLQVAPVFRIVIASRPDTLNPVTRIVGPDLVNDP